MEALEPPAWQQAAQCVKCDSSFGVFKRKHHCRNCGGTYCGNCSNWNISLPQFGFLEPVRVCEKCFNAVQRERDARGSALEPKKSAATATAAAVKPQISQSENKTNNNSDYSANSSASPAAAQVVAKVCTCGMPLCVCPDPTPKAQEEKVKSTSSSTSTKSAAKSQTQQSSQQQQSSGSSNFFGFSSTPAQVQYDLSGDLNEQCRDAIKAGDYEGVNKLLNAKADAKYSDRTGNSLLHLAAMFNRLDLVELLINKGADINKKNPSQESPLDLAPPALAHKMKSLAQS